MRKEKVFSPELLVFLNKSPSLWESHLTGSIPLLVASQACPLTKLPTLHWSCQLVLSTQLKALCEGTQKVLNKCIFKLKAFFFLAWCLLEDMENTMMWHYGTECISVHRWSSNKLTYHRKSISIHQLTPEHLFIYLFIIIYYLCIYLYGCPCGIWMFLSQGSNWSCSWGLPHSHSHSGSEMHLWPKLQLVTMPGP